MTVQPFEHEVGDQLFGWGVIRNGVQIPFTSPTPLPFREGRGQTEGECEGEEQLTMYGEAGWHHDER
jgi:hypothetical protein